PTKATPSAVESTATALLLTPCFVAQKQSVVPRARGCGGDRTELSTVLEEKCCRTFELLVVEDPVSAPTGSGIVERRPSLVGVPVHVRASIEQPFHPPQRAQSGGLMQHRPAVARAHLR